MPSATQLPVGLQPVVARDTLHELQAGAGRQHREVVVQVPVLRADVNADVLLVRIHGVRLLHPLHLAHERLQAQQHERLQLQIELLPVASGAVQWDRLSRHPLPRSCELHVLDRVLTAEPPLAPSIPAEPAAPAVWLLASPAGVHSEAPASAQV